MDVVVVGGRGGRWRVEGGGRENFKVDLRSEVDCLGRLDIDPGPAAARHHVWLSELVPGTSAAHDWGLTYVCSTSILPASW